MPTRTAMSGLGGMLGGAGILTMSNTHNTSGQGSSNLDKSSVMRTLSEHTIASIEVRRLPNRYLRFVGRNAFGTPAGRGGSRKIRILTTDKGATGWSQSWWPDDKVEQFMGARLSGLFDMDYGVLEEAYPLDQPLYDLIGNILGKPVYELIGNRGPREIPIYTGAIYFDDLEPEENPRGVAGVLESCQQDYDVGYRAFKLKSDAALNGCHARKVSSAMWKSPELFASGFLTVRSWWTLTMDTLWRTFLVIFRPWEIAIYTGLRNRSKKTAMPS